MKESFCRLALSVATIADNAMNPDQTVEFYEPVTLLGGGEVTPADLHHALGLACRLVAVDGGANMALAEGVMPDLVIGDFDSVTGATLAAIPADRQIRVAEQSTTDFEKCLMRLRAPFLLGLGFLGPRVDHTLAVFNALIGYADALCLLAGAGDLVFAAPPRLRLNLPIGTRFSLFPMAPCRGSSLGLRWPIVGLNFAPGGVIGTSNEVSGPVELTFEAAGMLVILPVETLAPVLTALRSGPRWPSPAGR